MMTPQEFISTFKAAFGDNTQLPIVFWFSDTAVADTQKVGGCMFKMLAQAREGAAVTLHEGNVACGGGKFYTGFAEMPEKMPTFVSLKEKYKDTPERCLDFVASIDQQKAPKPYLNFARIDKVESLENMEGLFFYATPDVLSGLTTWAYFDNNDEQTVAAPFGSGCSAVIQTAVRENRIGGKRTFIGLFDPSVRPHVGANELSYVIPRSRFESMQHTMKRCCLFDTHAWDKVKQRINTK